MGMLKVGDKIEILVDGAHSTTEKKGAILTVTHPDGYNPMNSKAFLTTSTDPNNGRWHFLTDSLLTGKTIRLVGGLPQVGAASITLPGTVAVKDEVNISTVTVSSVIKEEKARSCTCGAWAVKDHLHSYGCQDYIPFWKDGRR